ncbi:hypothetical protein EON65_02175 [archaeon]|nr:MAG: hypothetical protein EON65_02175 [archaeon]
MAYFLTDMNDLVIDYTAFTDQDTIVNLTNHTYWNLSGSLTLKIYDHHLQLSSSHYLPVDSTQIPTGQLEPVVNTPFDFTRERKLIESIMAIDGGGRAGLDHCFVVDGAVQQVEMTEGTRLDYDYDPLQQLQGTKNFLRHVATLTDPVSGRQLIVHATQPGVQVYTGNWLSQSSSDHPYTQHNAICLETQHFPDAVNQPHFPPVLLTKSDSPYYHTSVFSFRIR